MPELTAHSTLIPNLLPPSLFAILSGDPSSPPSSPPATAQSDGQGGTIPPAIAPASWESYAIFRETGLMYVTEPTFNAALRTVGEMLFSMLLEQYGNWPPWTESSTRTELHAALGADSGEGDHLFR